MICHTIFMSILVAGAPPVDPDLQQRAEALVAQLGDRDYRDRERAAKELLEMGYPAKEAVLAGQKSPDTEISERCRKLYPVIFQHDLERRVKAFLGDIDGPIPDDLPGARSWVKVAGDGKESRELYAEMVKAHPEMLLDLELNRERLRDAYPEFMRNTYMRIHARLAPGTPSTRRNPEDSEVLLFFFLGAVGDPRPTRIPGVSSTYYYQFLNSQFASSKLTGSVPFRKLYAGWLKNERYAIVVRRSLDIAVQKGIKECAPAALSVAGDPGISVTYRAMALIGFGRLGNKENVKDLEPFFDDKIQFGNVVVNGQRGTVQMRDVALGAALHLLELDTADFGFERKPPATVSGLSSYTYYAFSSDEKREAAHAKWKEWAEKNLKK